MARKPKMRVMERDLEEYKKLRKSYNDKLSRIKRETGFDVKRDGILEIDMPTPTIKQIKDGFFENREDYNKWKKEVSRIKSRTFEPLQIETNVKNLRYPKGYKEVGKKETAKAQEFVDDYRQKFEDLPRIVQGEEMGKVGDDQVMFSERNKYGIAKPIDFNIDDFREPEQLVNRIKGNEQRQDDSLYFEKKRVMRDNYASIFSDDDDPNKDLIAETILSMNPNTFYEFYLTHMNDITFDYYDSETGSIVQGHEDDYLLLQKYIEDYRDGNFNDDLKVIGNK